MNRSLVFLQAFVLAWLSLAILPSTAEATTAMKPAGLLTGAVEHALQLRLDGGKSLEHVTVADLFDHEHLATLDKLAGMPLEHRFQFLGTPQVLDPKTGHRILAVTAFQVVDDAHPGPGRQVVWRHISDSPPRGERAIYQGWVDEKQAQALFAAAHVPLANKGVWLQPSSPHVNDWPHVGWLAAGLFAAVFGRLMWRLKEHSWPAVCP